MNLKLDTTCPINKKHNSKSSPEKSEESLEIIISVALLAAIFYLVVKLAEAASVAAEVEMKERDSDREYIKEIFENMSKENLEKLVKLFKDAADSYDDAGDVLAGYFKYKIVQKMYHADPNGAYDIFVDRHYPDKDFSWVEGLVSKNVGFDVDTLVLNMLCDYLVVKRRTSDPIGRQKISGFNIDVLRVIMPDRYDYNQAVLFHKKMKSVLEDRDTTIQMERLFKAPPHIKLNPQLDYSYKNEYDISTGERTCSATGKVTCLYFIEPDKAYVNSLLSSVANDVETAENAIIAKANPTMNSAIYKQSKESPHKYSKLLKKFKVK